MSKNKKSDADPTLAEYLDFDLAWKRAKNDLTHVFVKHPFELNLIESDLAGWISELRNSVQDQSYRVRPMVVCDVPKGKGAIRPGAHLSIEDRVLFAACLGAAFPHIYSALAWSQGNVDFSYLLSSATDVHWLKNQFDGWRNFDKKTLEIANNGGITHVVFTDITGFYEHVTLETLMSDLRDVGVPEKLVQQLSSMLNKWAETPGRGLPQGHSPSDILAKVYLDSIDTSLRDQGFTHLRYVDDFRIFARSESEAKRAILELSRLLRRRGLSLQTAKTEIVTVDKAVERVEALTKTIVEVRTRFMDEVRIYYSMTGYLPFDDAERLVEELAHDENIGVDEMPIQIVRQTFEDHFENQDVGSLFDKSLFHFLLNRLGKANDPVAVEYCLGILGDHPEETKPILKYLERLEQLGLVDDVLASFMESDEAVYGYQKYLILEARLLDANRPSAEFLSVTRNLAFDASQSLYLRSAARAILGLFGTKADLERMQQIYSEAHSVLEQCEIICCLHRLEANRRNSFFARIKDDSTAHGRAVKFSKRADDT